MAAVAAESETGHQLAARDIVVRSAALVRAAGDAWARGQSPNDNIVRDAGVLATAAEQLMPAPTLLDEAGPLDEGVLSNRDPAGFLGSMIPTNLLPRLFEGDAVAPFISTLLTQVDEVTEPTYWRLIDDPPLTELRALRETLVDLHAASSERTRSRGRAAEVAFANAGRRGLRGVAHLARKRADGRLQRVIDDLEKDLANIGFPARVARQDGDFGSFAWPNDEVLVLVDVPTIYHWLLSIEQLLAVCRPALRDRIGFYLAPVRDGRIVASYGLHAFEDSAYPTEAVTIWPQLPLPLLDERLVRLVGRTFAGLDEASGILASLRRGDLHDDEAAALEQAISSARSATDEIASLVEGPDELLVAVERDLVEFHQQLDDELDASVRGTPVDRPFVVSAIDGVNGKPDETFNARAEIVAASAEWDVDPVDVFARIESAMQDLGSEPEES